MQTSQFDQWYSMIFHACRNLSYRLPVKSTFWRHYLIVWFWCYQCDWCTLLFEPMAASTSALHPCDSLQPPWIVVMDFELLRTNLLWRTSELSFLAQKKHASHWKSCTELPKQLPWFHDWSHWNLNFAGENHQNSAGRQCQPQGERAASGRWG